MQSPNRAVRVLRSFPERISLRIALACSGWFWAKVLSVLLIVSPFIGLGIAAAKWASVRGSDRERRFFKQRVTRGSDRFLVSF